MSALLTFLLTLAVPSYSDRNQCTCPTGQQVWFKDATLKNTYYANGFGTDDTSHATHAFVSFMVPGITADYNTIAGYHDMCYEICGVSKEFCDDTSYSMGYQYCYCAGAIGGSKLGCWGWKLGAHVGTYSRQKCNLKSVSKIDKDDRSPFLQCQAEACTCIPKDIGGSTASSDRIKKYLQSIYKRLPNHMKPPHTKKFEISKTEKFDAEKGREYILDVMEDVGARNEFIEGQKKHMEYVIKKGDEKNQKKWKKRDNTIHKDRRDKKKLKYCKNTEAAKFGFIDVQDKVPAKYGYLFSGFDVVVGEEALVVVYILVMMLMICLGWFGGVIAGYMYAKLRMK